MSCGAGTGPGAPPGVCAVSTAVAVCPSTNCDPWQAERPHAQRAARPTHLAGTWQAPSAAPHATRRAASAPAASSHSMSPAPGCDAPVAPDAESVAAGSARRSLGEGAGLRPALPPRALRRSRPERADCGFCALGRPPGAGARTRPAPSTSMALGRVSPLLSAWCVPQLPALLLVPAPISTVNACRSLHAMVLVLGFCSFLADKYSADSMEDMRPSRTERQPGAGHGCPCIRETTAMRAFAQTACSSVGIGRHDVLCNRASLQSPDCKG